MPKRTRRRQYRLSTKPIQGDLSEAVIKAAVRNSRRRVKPMASALVKAAIAVHAQKG